MSKPEGTIEILINELNEAGILRLTLNDAGCRNALSEAMLTHLDKAFTLPQRAQTYVLLS